MPVENDTPAGEAPGPPRSLTAEADGASVIELNWRSPLDRGSSAIIGYWIEVSTDGGVTWSSREHAEHRDPLPAHGPHRGTTRHYRVSAINSYDTGGPSNVDQRHDGGRCPGRADATDGQGQGDVHHRSGLDGAFVRQRSPDHRLPH